MNGASWQTKGISHLSRPCGKIQSIALIRKFLLSPGPGKKPRMWLLCQPPRPIHPLLFAFTLQSIVFIFVHLYLTHAKTHLQPIAILVQLTWKENERILKLKALLSLASSPPWLKSLYEPHQTAAPDSLSSITFMLWSGHLRCRKPASLSDISSDIWEGDKIIPQPSRQRGAGGAVFPLLGKDPFN